jgi:hypothetical protein
MKARIHWLICSFAHRLIAPATQIISQFFLLFLLAAASAQIANPPKIFLTKSAGNISAVLDTLTGRFAIRSTDGRTILFANEYSVTSYFRENREADLFELFVDQVSPTARCIRPWERDARGSAGTLEVHVADTLDKRRLSGRSGSETSDGHDVE